MEGGILMSEYKYDYLVVGAGLSGAIFAYYANKLGKKVLVIDKRNHIAGNIYTEKEENIDVHKYGAHIFHTSNKKTWEFINNFADFNRFTNSPKAYYKGRLYSLPFNMNTFYELFDEKDPNKVKEIIQKQIEKENINNPSNLEEQAISLVGRDVYETLVKGYTQKQWGEKCTNLPPFIIKRLPLRFTFDNNYFNSLYQGIPINGYTDIIQKMLKGIEVKLNTPFKKDMEKHANKIIYTGCIDQYFEYKLGYLSYRSLRFEQETLNIENYQGNAVINYTEYEIPFTRIIEHKHFTNAISNKTIITKEYPLTWSIDKEPYYPINNEENNTLYKKYQELANKQNKVIFMGRLGLYQYLDMDKTIEKAQEITSKELNI